MKKITKPAEREEAIYYSDFTGKILDECGPDVTLKLQFSYGSKRDGARMELHLNDEDTQPILELIKQKISPDTKEEYKKNLAKKENSYYDSMQSRDWASCDIEINDIWLLRYILDIKDEETDT